MSVRDGATGAALGVLHKFWLVEATIVALALAVAPVEPRKTPERDVSTDDGPKAEGHVPLSAWFNRCCPAAPDWPGRIKRSSSTLRSGREPNGHLGGDTRSGRRC